MTFRLGQEVWALFHVDGRHEPRLMGRIERIDRRGGLAGGQWWPASTFPLFASRDEADEWIAGRPSVDAAPKQFGNVR